MAAGLYACMIGVAGAAPGVERTPATVSVRVIHDSRPFATIATQRPVWSDKSAGG